MTKKSFIDDAYVSSFESKIIALEKKNGKNAIVLDHTYFYPEGGGQPTDKGRIDNLFINDVQLHDENIYHFTEQPIEQLNVGQVVKCEIDFFRRLSLMQQHTGQHILSSCAEKWFDANTVGFHIGEDYVTVDLDKKLNMVDVDQLEKKANDVVFMNLEVKAHYPSSDELSEMPLRKQPKVTENIRVIEVDGVDFSPCGGTHLRKTSEVGLIKIKRIENYKTGIRIEFCCGYFALDTFKKRNDTVNQLMRLFSVKDDEIVSFCEQMLENQKQDKMAISTLKEQLFKLQVSSLIQSYEEAELESDIKVITLIEEDSSMVDLRLKSSMIAE
ncbi:MAG TPA: hypothetical protein DCS67_07900, partial [Clostridiales bacterium UBA8960]|nr:hypothetical protein [Clostridiales bacterium UBA8960]